MSTRQTGNRHENSFCELAEELGYCAFPARGSRGPIDVVCFGSDNMASWRVIPVPLVVQVGTHNKPIARTLAELAAAPRPIGSLCIVARRRLTKSRRVEWTFHTRAGKFHSLAEAIAERKAA